MAMRGDTRGIKKKREKNNSLGILGRIRAVEGKSNSRERKSNFSLDFPAFGPSVRVGPKSKVVLRGKGYAWAPVLGEFRQLREVGVISY